MTTDLKIIGAFIPRGVFTQAGSTTAVPSTCAVSQLRLNERTSTRAFGRSHLCHLSVSTPCAPKASMFCGDIGITHVLLSSSRSSTRLLTTSPMLMISASFPSRTTGMCRTRCRVTSFITRLILSSGETVITWEFMTSLTGIDPMASPLRASLPKSARWNEEMDERSARRNQNGPTRSCR